ncbi:MAG TPA: PilZ domain-containing protein [Pyrinomonadaceae bacterium]|nr:PilZ domain-containing protein [Pyrinomonadaceae bacterium]
MIEDSYDNPAARNERRGHDRSRLIVDVFYDGKEGTGIASSRDIGVGGLYMNTTTVIPEGSVLLIRIPLPRGKQIVCNAEVVYSNPGLGVGIRFQGLTDDARARLENELKDV